MDIHINNIEDLVPTAHLLLEKAGAKRVFLFSGDMGVGKTTLIKEMCKVLGVSDTTSSPTFSIVNEYQSPGGPVYHFDFYRIRSEQEAYDMGYEEYFYSGSYCFVEWPEKISGLLPEDAALIRIRLADPPQRVLTLEA